MILFDNHRQTQLHKVCVIVYQSR